MSEDIWLQHRLNEKVNNRAYQIRRERWVDRIQGDPIIDLKAIKISAESLHRLANEVTSQIIYDWSETEHLGMDFLTTAIHAGAFSGIEWLEWRTRLAGKPHIMNAATFLSKYAPPSYRFAPTTESGVRESTCWAMRTMANIIELLIRQIEQSPEAQQRAAPKVLPSPVTVVNDHHDEILQALVELQAFDQSSRKTTKEISKRAIGAMAALHKKDFST